jgi:hypothetical protein
VPRRAERFSGTLRISMRTALDWFSNLPLWQKVLAVPFGALLVFSVLNIVVSGASSLLTPEGGESAPAVQNGSRGELSVTEPSAAPKPASNRDLRIVSARWVGEKVEVEGSWSGEISSVHCDLFEGSESKRRTTDWWDRGVSPATSASERTFTQEFVQAQGSRIEDPPDPKIDYTVVCSGAFSEGWSVSDTAPVEDTPPG